MKKFIVGSFALLTLVLATSSAPAFAGASSKRVASPATEAFIPPPACPANDPNGCGILD